MSAKLRRKIALIRAIRLSIHLGALLGVFACPPSRAGLLALALGYLVGMLGVTLGYHRYFAHRAFKTSRAMQLLLALAAMSTLQRGVLWWAAVHRHHHRRSDAEGDYHSPREGLWHAHWSWLDSERVHAVELDSVADFARFPELRALERIYYLPALTWGIACAGLGAALGGKALELLIYGALVRTVLVWHVTFSVNSLAHVIGRRRFATGDTSRNWLPLALLGLGEGWHNNHHRFPSAARFGMSPGELDLGHVFLRGLAWLGLVWDLREVPSELLDKAQREAAAP